MAYASMGNRKKRTITLRETGVEHTGMFGENECILYDRTDQARALLALSEAIGLWRREAGEDALKGILERATHAMFVISEGSGTLIHLEIEAARSHTISIVLIILAVQMRFLTN